MEKRGQAAAFIIIGIVIVVVMVAFLAIKNDILKSLFEKLSSESRNVPQQIKPLKEFIDSCVAQVTEEGIKVIALQGGYLNLPNDKIPTSEFTPLGSNLEIIKNSDIKTSVWFRERGNGIQEVNVPQKETVEKEIASYVANNFARCVNNLTEFNEKGIKTSANGLVNAQVKIENKKVATTVEFPIEVKIASTNFTLKNHQANIDSNFGLMYTMAKEILETENKEYFLENKTIDMLVAYDEEVPFSGTDFSCTEKIWLKQDVERKLKNILFENVAAMHIKGTNYKLKNEKSKYLEFKALKTENKEITANLMYLPNWPTVVEINPSEGNVLKSDLILKKAGGPISAIMSSFFCLNQHRFVYDLKYPVLIILKDPSGLIFQYATEVIIDNNEPRQNRKEILNIPEVNSQVCKYPKKEVEIYTGTLDASGAVVPLDNVSINFKCFPTTCPIGTSELNKDGDPIVNAVFPQCFNGFIEGTKEGYKQIQKVVYSSNLEDAPSKVFVQLEPYYEKKVNLVVIEKETGKLREPYSSEQINFQFISTETNYQTVYTSFNQGEKLKLLPGEYIINSYILRNSSTYKITIPKQTIENCIDTTDSGLFGIFNSKKVCAQAETPAMEFDTILTGGATNFKHKFSREDVASDKALNLYVLTSEIPTSTEEVQKVQISLDLNKDHKLFREPDFENE